MAIGDDASDAGYPLVPDTGAGGEVKYGAREINRTRDMIAQLKALITTRKFTSSTTVPAAADGVNGDVHFRTI